MDPFDPAIQNTSVFGWRPLVTLGLFTSVGAFFFGALVTAINRGVKEKGWFNYSKHKDD